MIEIKIFSIRIINGRTGKDIKLKCYKWIVVSALFYVWEGWTLIERLFINTSIQNLNFVVCAGDRLIDH
jgi:hypothetical protein